MKLKLPLTFLGMVALAACAGTSSSNALADSLVDEAMAHPNQTLLQSVMGMVTQDGLATETDIEVDANVTTSASTTVEAYDESYLSENTFELVANAEMKTNDLRGEVPQASLVLDLTTLNVSMYDNLYGENSSSLALADQHLELYYDTDTIYADFTAATDVLDLLSGGVAPEKFQAFAGTPEELGLVVPEMTQEEIDEVVAQLLPTLESVPLLDHSIEGTHLVISYVVTQEDLPGMIEEGLRATLLTQEFTSEELSMIEEQIPEAVAQIVDMFTIRTFSIVAHIDLLSNTVTSLVADVDLDFQVSDETLIGYYDPENPQADEYGLVYVNQTFNQALTVDVYLAISMETFLEDRPIAVPGNKEDYVVMAD